MDFKLFLAVFLIWVATNDASDEHSLIKNMLKNYQTQGRNLARPVTNTSEILKVKFGMKLIEVEVHEVEHQVTLRSWLTISWKDDYLVWDPAAYNGLKSVFIAPTEIWKPDIVAYKRLFTEVEDTLAVVSHDGTVLWIPPVTMRMSCNKISGGLFRSTKFSCPMVFGSWVHNGFQLDMDFYGAEEIDLGDYAATNTWTVGDHSGKKNTAYYPCCAEPYPSFKYNLTLTQK